MIADKTKSPWRPHPQLLVPALPADDVAVDVRVEDGRAVVGARQPVLSVLPALGQHVALAEVADDFGSAAE